MVWMASAIPAQALLARVPSEKARTHSGASAGWERRKAMLETIAVILIVLWLLGLVSSYTMGGFIHILLVIAVVVILVRVLQGRRPLG